MKAYTIAIGLVLGAVLGTAGSMAPAGPGRNVLYAISGIGLIVACLLLAAGWARRSRDEFVAGFGLLALGEAVLFSGLADPGPGSQSAFAGGVSLYVPGLLLVSLPKGYALWSRGAGALAGLAFALVSLQILMGQTVPPDSALPGVAYTLYAGASVGWLIAALREERTSSRGESAAALPSEARE